METSLIEIQQAERYLQKQLPPGEMLLFEARMLTDPTLRLNVSAQQEVYDLLVLYRRKKLLEKAEVVHQRIFRDPLRIRFQRSIHQLFT